MQQSIALGTLSTRAPNAGVRLRLVRLLVGRAGIALAIISLGWMLHSSAMADLPEAPLELGVAKAAGLILLAFLGFGVLAASELRIRRGEKHSER